MRLLNYRIAPLSIENLKGVVDEVVAKFSNPQKSEYSLNAIMGEVMKVARNRIDGKLVSDVVKTKLKNVSR